MKVTFISSVAFDVPRSAFDVYRQAQQRTMERGEPVDALWGWMRQAEPVAQLMLEKKIQLLELMGPRAQRR